MSGLLLQTAYGYWVCIHFPKIQFRVDAPIRKLSGSYCWGGGGKWESCLLFYLYTHFVFESSCSSSLFNTACSTPHSDEWPHSVSEGRALLSIAPEELRLGWLLDVCVCVFATETVHRSWVKKLKMFLTREGPLFSCCCSFCSLHGKV